MPSIRVGINSLPQFREVAYRNPWPLAGPASRLLYAPIFTYILQACIGAFPEQQIPIKHYIVLAFLA